MLEHIALSMFPYLELLLFLLLLVFQPIGISYLLISLEFIVIIASLKPFDVEWGTYVIPTGDLFCC